MTLVERFIEFRSWPTSRKSALLYGLALPFHVFCTLTGQWTASKLPWIDGHAVQTVYWWWSAEVAFCFLVSLFAVWRGWEARWTLWLNMIPYGVFMALAIALFGFASTAFAVWFPSVIVLVTVWFGTRDGFYAFLYGAALVAAWSVLSATGRLPFAPALLDRSIDVQNNPIWDAQVFSSVLLYFAFCFTLVVLLISAQELQQKRLDEAQQKLDRSNRLIGRYVPSQLAEKIIRGEHTELFRPERAKLTVFFSDVEGFTDASDHLDPEDLAGLLNEYLSEMISIAERYGATVSQIVGDGMMIFFGAPQVTSDRDHALRAVRMALEMQRRMGELRDVWSKRGIGKPFRVRIGINTGYVSVGDYGSRDRKLYSAIGVQTNLAARIQTHCEPGAVLLSHTTWSLVRDEIECVDKGELPLKGVHYPIRVYQVALGAAETSSGKVIQWPLSAS